MDSAKPTYGDHLIPPPNGLFETLDEYRPITDFVALRTPVQRMEFFFLTKDITKPPLVERYPDRLSDFPVKCTNHCITPIYSPCLGFWNALTRFIFNILGIFQNECDFDDRLNWIDFEN